MPIHGPNSYPATMSAFIQHWSDLNATLGSAVVVSGGRTVSTLTGWLAQVEAKLAQVTAGTFAAANRKLELDGIKDDIISWCVLFNATVRANHVDAACARNLVPAPGASAGRGTFTTPVVQTQQIWDDLNAGLGEPLTLRRRTTRKDGSLRTETLAVAGLSALLDAMQAKWDEWIRAQQAVDNIREQRNDVMKLAYACMRDYRQVVPLELPAGHALTGSLPALNPDPARKVRPPVASGTWNSATEKADLTAAASPDADVQRTELRFSPADPYDTNNEIVLTSIPAGQTLTFSTKLGLSLRGDISRFTWVAVTAGGGEGRSNVVSVTRT